MWVLKEEQTHPRYFVDRGIDEFGSHVEDGSNLLTDKTRRSSESS